MVAKPWLLRADEPKQLPKASDDVRKGLDPLEYTMVSSSRQFIDAQIVDIRQV